MPMYEYECEWCGEREERLRPVADRNKSFPCPHCNDDCPEDHDPAYMQRTISAPAPLASTMERPGRGRG